MPSTRKPRKPAREKFDVYKVVTDQILEQLRQGTVPWRRPWKDIGGDGMHRNLVSKHAYRGVNIFLLDMAAITNGWEQPWWVSFKQAKQLGGTVRKGEKSTFVTFWKKLRVKAQPDEAADAEGMRTIMLLRYYRVFNIAQVDGIAPGKIPPPVDDEKFDPIATCEQIIGDYRDCPPITHRGDQAGYHPGSDRIAMPARAAFADREAYYATLFHEAVHSTGHPKRLDRKDGMAAAFGSAKYAHEELCAEIGAAFLCRVARIDTQPLGGRQAAYIAGWLQALENDTRLVVSAAGRAQRAADYMLGRTFDDTPPAASGDTSDTQSKEVLAHA